MRADATVILLTHNEEKNIGRALRSVLRGSQLPAAVFIIDNCSTDHTQLVVDQIRGEFPDTKVRWISSGQNNLAVARALGVSLAATEFVAFLDADCEAPISWLAGLLTGMQRCEERYGYVAGVGGEALPPNTGEEFYELLTLSRRSFLGNLRSPQAMPVRRDCAVSHLPTANALFRRSSLLVVGNFDRDFGRVCEDVEIAVRLRKQGNRLFLLRGSSVGHYHRISWPAWAERIFRFGYGQMLVARLHPMHLSPRLWLPLLFLHGFTAALLLSGETEYFLLIPLLYFLLLLALSFYHAHSCAKRSYVPKLIFLFILTHFSYALGEALGFYLVFLPAMAKQLFLELQRIFLQRKIFWANDPQKKPYF